jgi:hypothetical protein
VIARRERLKLCHASTLERCNSRKNEVEKGDVPRTQVSMLRRAVVVAAGSAGCFQRLNFRVPGSKISGNHPGLNGDITRSTR